MSLYRRYFYGGHCTQVGIIAQSASMCVTVNKVTFWQHNRSGVSFSELYKGEFKLKSFIDHTLESFDFNLSGCNMGCLCYYFFFSFMWFVFIFKPYPPIFFIIVDFLLRTSICIALHLFIYKTFQIYATITFYG